MDDVRIGSSLRVIRVRKRLRQADVARRAGVHRETVSRVERGGAGRVRLDELRRIAIALGASVDVLVRWRGGDLDRVVNAAHADLHEAVVRHLAARSSWVWRPEVSFSIYGERGVVDILAWHAESRSLLIIELKTELVDPQALAASMGRRVRLGPDIAATLGWHPVTVSGWVIVSEGSTNRRRARRHSTLLGSAFPQDGRAMRRWLGQPTGAVNALSFWSDVRSGSLRRTVGQTQRIRASRAGDPERGRRRGRASVSAAERAQPSNGPRADI